MNPWSLPLGWDFAMSHWYQFPLKKGSVSPGIEECQLMYHTFSVSTDVPKTALISQSHWPGKLLCMAKD